MLDLKQLTGDVCRIATEAGHFLKEERKNFRRESVVEKHAHDYVSYVDKESEVRIVKALSALLPEAGFITEEGSATYQDEPYCWAAMKIRSACLKIKPWRMNLNILWKITVLRCGISRNMIRKQSGW